MAKFQWSEVVGSIAWGYPWVLIVRRNAHCFQVAPSADARDVSRGPLAAPPGQARQRCPSFAAKVSVGAARPFRRSRRCAASGRSPDDEHTRGMKCGCTSSGLCDATRHTIAVRGQSMPRAVRDAQARPWAHAWPVRVIYMGVGAGRHGSVRKSVPAVR